MEGSILEFIGTELIGVITPVSICMFLVVLLVYTLSPPQSLSSFSPTQSPIITAANLVYNENPNDSPAQKLEGAALNAVVFVLIIALATFILVLLYYYNFTNFLKNYMRVSTFLLLSTMGGAIFLSLIKHFNLPFDAITCFLVLFNFSGVGVVSVFGGGGVPIIVTQGYTVVLGIITAAWFTQLPEWTTWVLLVALAVYDLVAVLAPGGPLKTLVELSQSRDDDLPALVYEARPTVSSSGGRRGSIGALVGGVSDNRSVELQNLSRDGGQNRGVERNVGVGGNDHGSGNNGMGSIEEIAVEEGRGETSPLVQNTWRTPPENVDRQVNEERSPLVETGRRREEREEDESEASMSRGIKLGLGDFVFYSVLVGRAAMYDLMTVYACYLAIISGLACTLMLLSVYGRALPALPISITLGVMFYFLTRLLLEPFVVQTSTNLLMF